MPTQPNDIATWKATLQTMTAKRESLEAELSQASSKFRTSKSSPSLKQVVQSLPVDGVLIDFFQYGIVTPDPMKGKFNSVQSIMASVVKPDGSVQAIYLGDSNAISNLIDSWRDTFGHSMQGQAVGKQLRQTVWEPLLPLIGDAKTIIVSTDGPLGRLAFATLPGRKEGIYLLEDHRLATVPVPQLIPLLLKPDVDRKLDKHLLLLGDVDYFADPDKPKQADMAILPWQRRSTDAIRGGKSLFERLENTSGEIAVHRTIISQSTLG